MGSVLHHFASSIQPFSLLLATDYVAAQISIVDIVVFVTVAEAVFVLQ